LGLTRGFLLTIVAWVLFVVSGFIFIQKEINMKIDREEIKNPIVSNAIYNGTADLTKLKGEQLIGMIPFALDGEFTLFIDGIPIDSNTDISTINLRGVPGLLYTIYINRDSLGNISSIIATH
jgi:hypothetical protein